MPVTVALVMALSWSRQGQPPSPRPPCFPSAPSPYLTKTLPLHKSRAVPTSQVPSSRVRVPQRVLNLPHTDPCATRSLANRNCVNVWSSPQIHSFLADANLHQASKHSEYSAIRRLLRAIPTQSINPYFSVAHCFLFSPSDVELAASKISSPLFGRDHERARPPRCIGQHPRSTSRLFCPSLFRERPRATLRLPWFTDQARTVYEPAWSSQLSLQNSLLLALLVSIQPTAQRPIS
jgi:hypothetical protein